MLLRLCVFLTALIFAALPFHSVAAAAESGCATLDCKIVTPSIVRREMKYRTHHAAVAKVLISMQDETHITIATNLLYGSDIKPVSVVVDNADARSVADALYNVFSFAYQKDTPEISDSEIRESVARKTIFIERQDFQNALEFFSFADLSNVTIFRQGSTITMGRKIR